MKIDANKMTAIAVRELLQKIVDKLDELDEDDYFGSDGWQHYFGVE